MKSTNARTLGVGWRLEGQTTRNLPALFINEVSVDTRAPPLAAFGATNHQGQRHAIADIGRWPES